jgi:transcriptional regulator with XRE-family HTH domain
MTIAFGRLIRRHRQLRGWSQADLADRVDGLSEFDIARMEWGDAGPARRAALESLAKALELPPRLLLMASGWYAAQNASPKVALDPSHVAIPPELTAEHLALIREELAGLQDVERELAAWLDDVFDRLDRAVRKNGPPFNG